MEVKPCNGELPVVDPSTGQDLDCGNGPLRQDCPSDSYCHQTPHFAKCCRKGKFPLRLSYIITVLDYFNYSKCS